MAARRAVEDHLDVFDFLAAEFQRVDQAAALMIAVPC
jgi:hypothetical protein